MRYNKAMTDLFGMMAYTAMVVIFIFGAAMAGWLARGYVDKERQDAPTRGPILQPEFATTKPSPLPTPSKIPAAVTPARSTVMKFPKPAEVRKRKDEEALSSYLDSLVGDPRQSGSFSLVSPDKFGA